MDVSEYPWRPQDGRRGADDLSAPARFLARADHHRRHAGRLLIRLIARPILVPPGRSTGGRSRGRRSGHTPAAMSTPSPRSLAGSLSTPAAAGGVLLRRLSGYAGAVAAVTAAGLAGRLLFLGHQPLWRDEAFTAVVVQRPIGSMLDAVRSDSAPPLGYLLDHAVASLWSGPAALRLAAALAGAGAIPLGAALGRRIGGDRGGLVTALLCALTPALVLSARDARMYALATTLVMASTLLLWRAVERPSRLRWGAYAAVTALAVLHAVLRALRGGRAAGRRRCHPSRPPPSRTQLRCSLPPAACSRWCRGCSSPAPSSRTSATRSGSPGWDSSRWWACSSRSSPVRRWIPGSPPR